MNTTIQIILLALTVMLYSCGSQIKKKTFEHTYLKYWDKYSEQQLADTLFSDTLSIGPDAEGGWSTRGFYIKTTKELLADLQDDKNNVDSLYPMTPFDELTIKKLPLGIRKTFSNEQSIKFLELINDPVSFNWAETTYEPEFQIDFLKDNKVVASLTVDAGISVIKTKPDWPAFEKFKFGCLKKDLTQLLLEVGQF